MLIKRGYKYELDPNNKQRTIFSQCAGLARFTWNWGLADRKKRYAENKGKLQYTTFNKQDKLLNQLKITDFEWMYEYSSRIPKQVLRDLQESVDRYFKDKSEGKNTGYPKFKKKGKSKDSFYLEGSIHIYPDTKKVQLPRTGLIRLKETPKIPDYGRVLSAQISRTADRWYIAFTVEEEVDEPIPNDELPIAMDIGIKCFGALSNGLILPNPKFLRKKLRKLQRLQRKLARQKKGSKNREKTKLLIARCHRDIVNTRQDHHHKLSNWLTKNHGAVIIEDLPIGNFFKFKKLAKYWQELAHSEFKRQLRYKSFWYGSELVEADRWFPSSKLCSNCHGYKKDLDLNDRIYECQFCGLKLDRDVNAALNLEWYYNYIHTIYNYDDIVAGGLSETLNASGEHVRPELFRQSSMKQELESQVTE